MGGVLESLEDLPPWVAIGVPLAIVGVALLSSRSNGGGGVSYGAVTAYSPVPVDAGIIALEQSTVEAKANVVNTIASIYGATDISRMASERDIALTRIQADAQNLRTEAERQAALAHESVTQRLGLAGLDATQALARINASSALALSRDEGATRKYEAKQATKRGIADTVGGVIKSGLGFIGKLF
jgi:hypothetical protein